MLTKKEKVINTSRELFSTYGYKKVSMDEIAKQSKVTKKTIYTYFNDKNDLIKYFLNEELKNIYDLSEEISKKPIPFTDKIHETIMEIIDYRMNSKLLSALTKEQDKSYAIECTKILNNTICEYIEKRLDQAIEEGYVKPCNTKIVAFITYKVYFALLFEWDEPVNKKEVADSIFDFLKNGIFI